MVAKRVRTEEDLGPLLTQSPLSQFKSPLSASDASKRNKRASAAAKRGRYREDDEEDGPDRDKRSPLGNISNMKCTSLLSTDASAHVRKSLLTLTRFVCRIKRILPRSLGVADPPSAEQAVQGPDPKLSSFVLRPQPRHPAVRREAGAPRPRVGGRPRPVHAARDQRARPAEGRVEEPAGARGRRPPPVEGAPAASARGRRLHVRLRHRSADRGLARLHHGRRDGPGEDAAVHHPDVDAPEAGARLQGAHREGRRGGAEQPRQELVQRDSEVARRARVAAGDRRRLQGRDRQGPARLHEHVRAAAGQSCPHHLLRDVPAALEGPAPGRGRSRSLRRGTQAKELGKSSTYIRNSVTWPRNFC